jgi:hypothetical protein
MRGIGSRGRGGFFVAVALLITACGSVPASPDVTASAANVLLDVSGNGSKSTQKFSAARDWDLDWSFDCVRTGQEGNLANFIVTVKNEDGSASRQNQPVNQVGLNGREVTHYHKGGTFYLDVNTQCSWRMVVKG